jgi:hypothetical protein
LIAVGITDPPFYLRLTSNLNYRSLGGDQEHDRGDQDGRASPNVFSILPLVLAHFVDSINVIAIKVHLAPT